MADAYLELLQFQNAPIRVEKIDIPKDRPDILDYWKSQGENVFPVRVYVGDILGTYRAYDLGQTISIPGTSRGNLLIPREEVKGLD